MKLVTENELQTHSMKMHQITNLSAVIYNQEQPSMVKPLEEQILVIYYGNFAFQMQESV